MTNTNQIESPEDTITRYAKECYDDARSAGWDLGAYELTEEDCTYIHDGFVIEHGRRPTKAEWAAAHYHNVGSAHYEG